MFCHFNSSRAIVLLRLGACSQARWKPRSSASCRGAGQTHCEHRALARLARHGHVAAHHARELAREGKAEPRSAVAARDIEDATRTINQKLFVAKASNDTELNAALASLVRHGVRAVLVAADPYFDTRRDRIIAFAADNRIPAIYQFREFAVAGGLISYGPSITDSYRQAGIYAGRILKGVKPADLPVLQPTKFELVINLKTAKALGLDVPNSVQLLADEVIE
jgi:ABC-type uncharacterized transport system substrate-binding protein